jgi:hypothetical protein
MELFGSAVWIYTFHARQVFVPRESIAGVNAIARAMLLASVSIGSLIYLPLAERIGVRMALALQGVPLLLAALIWVSRRSLRGMRLARAA